jgi:hypothetical protein
MPIKINDDFMYLEIDGTVIAIASRRARGWWEASPLAQVLDRGHAVEAEHQQPRRVSAAEPFQCCAEKQSTDLVWHKVR